MPVSRAQDKVVYSITIRMEVLVHYGDLALKGKNRSDFTAALVRNAESAAGGRCETHRERIVMRGGNPENLAKVFGISWYARCHTCPKSIDEIVKLVLRRVEKILSRCGGEKKPSPFSSNVRTSGFQ